MCMGDAIRVLVLGTGQMGSGIARLVHEKQGLTLAGAYARRSARAGLDIGHAIGLEHALGVSVSNDLASAVEQSLPQVAIQATCSHIADAKSEIEFLVDRGVAVISIAEQMAYPACSSPAFAEAIHRLALSRDVALVGCGINPGFVLDLLVVALSGVCADVRAINAERVNDLSPYGPTVLESQGVGLSPQAFEQGLASGKVVGHVGFPESIQLIAHAVGWDIDRIEERRQPIIARVARVTPFVRVEPGQVAGCLHTAVAYRGDHPVITLTHPQQVHPQSEGIATGDRIQISGTPDVRLAGSPEIPGGLATCALAVNMIPHILNAAPGLHSMADLPVPAAMLGDARRRLRNRGS